MKLLVGTSGWMYSWNPDGFTWYIKNSGLETIELNMSFYRFPSSKQVKNWVKHTIKSGLRWSIKVHRLITHTYLLSERAIEHMDRMISLFEPLNEYIDFYLIQLPPRFKAEDKFQKRIKDFVKHFNLGWRLAIEFRDLSWFKHKYVDWAEKQGFTYVSVDSPEATFYGRSGPYIYIRFHGRTLWYLHYYTDSELEEVAATLLRLKGEKIYAYFNNNHDMLENARRFKDILRSLAERIT